MKKYMTWYYLLTKRLIRHVFFWIIIGLIIVLPIVMKYELAARSSLVRVLVANQGTGNNTCDLLFEKLLSYDNGTIRFEDGISEEKTREEITRGYAHAGYIIPADLDERVEGYLHGSVELLTAIKSEAELSVMVIDEIVYGALYDAIAENVAKGYAEELSDKNQERDSFIHAQYEGYLNAEMPFDFQHEDGSEYTELNRMGDSRENTFILSPVLGLIGVLIAVAALSGGVYLYEDEDKNILMRLNGASVHIVRLIYILAPTVPVAVAGWGAGVCIGIGNPEWEALRMLVYITMLVPLTYLVRLIIRSGRLYLAMIPVFTVWNLLAGAVFAELDLPALIWLQRFNPLYYAMML